MRRFLLLFFAITVLALVVLTPLRTVGARASGYVVSDSSYYVSLGDSAATGYGHGEHRDNGYKSTVSTAYPFLLANGLELKEEQFVQLACDGFRLEDVIYLLDAEATPDDYGQRVTVKEMELAGGVESYREDYVSELARADLITLGFQHANVSDFLSAQLSAFITGKRRYQIDWSRYFDQEAVAKINDTVEQLQSLLLGAGLPEEIELLGRKLKVVDTCITFVESLFYGYVGYVQNHGRLIDLIREINPAAQIVVVGSYNPLKDCVVIEEELALPVGMIFGVVTSTVNDLLYQEIKTRLNVSFVRPTEAQSFFTVDLQDGQPSLIGLIMSLYRESAISWNATEESHFGIAEALASLLTVPAPTAPASSDGEGVGVGVTVGVSAGSAVAASGLTALIFCLVKRRRI